MSVFENHVRCVLSAVAIGLLVAGCRTARTVKNGCADCDAGAQSAIARRDGRGDTQFDRPSAPPATIPDDEPDSPVQADSAADASQSEEREPTAAGKFEGPPDLEILTRRLQARGGEITRDAYLTVVSIDLSGCDVIDADLEYLHLFKDLQQLNLSGTRISNAGLDYLSGLRALEFLGLTGTQVDDDGLRRIAGLGQLRFLSLAGTDVTDAGLKSLSGMRNLEAINLRSTRATAFGVSELQSRLPECRIVFEDPQTSLWLNGGRAGSGAAPSAVLHGQSDLIRMYPTPDRMAAQQQFELVLRRKMNDPDVLHALAAVRASEGDWREAEATIRAALEKRPDDRGLQFDRAVALAQCLELKAAFEQFAHAVGRPAAHYNLGVLLVERGRFAAGRSHFLEAVEQDPTIDAAHEWLALTDGDKALPPHHTGRPGLLTNRAIGNMFGPTLRETPAWMEELRPINSERPSADEAAFRPLSRFSAPLRPINWSDAGLHP